MANKYYAITVGSRKIGFTAKEEAYPAGILTEIGVDDVSENLKGVDMRANVGDYCPRIAIRYEDAAKKKRTAYLYCAREKLATITGSDSTLIDEVYKTGTKILSVELPRKRVFV